METFFIYSHVTAATVVLLVGLIQMVNRKGTRSHVVWGKTYVTAMWWVCLSALAIISFYRFNAFLMVIAVLTFYSSFVGVRVLKRRIPGTEAWYDWVVSSLTALFGLGLFGYAISLLISGHLVFGLLCAVFGVMTAHGAIRDLLFFYRRNPGTKAWWLKQHIGAMGGSYIAAITAFAVQNPDLFMPGSSFQWILWLLPSVIGSPIISRVIRRRLRSYA